MKIRHIAGALILLFPGVALAHAFGQQFTLPLPVNYYIFGGLAAFIASCAVILLFSDPVAEKRDYTVEIAWKSAPLVKKITTSISLALFLCFIAIGYLGGSDFLTNPLPNLFWIIFLLLFAYLCAVVGGLWDLVDPFKTTANFLAPERTTREAPKWLQDFPVLLLYGLLWLELFSPGWGAIPAVIASVLLGYLVLGVVMSRLYGTKAWFRDGDLFNTFFGVIGKVAPIRLGEGFVRLSPPGELLAHEKDFRESTLVFVFVFLGGTIVDGLKETTLWWNIGYSISSSIYFVTSVMGVIGIVVLPILISNIYSFSLWCMKKLAHVQRSVQELRIDFAHSLIPIAVVYHFAHYFSLILTQGQTLLSQISDPLAKGWNIFGTAGAANQIVVGADKIWYIQLSALILGHVLAAIVAHRIAVRLFASKRDVIVSQLPMLVLMVGFTAFGLWTLAQPFVR